MKSIAKSIQMAMLLVALIVSSSFRHEARGEEDPQFGAWALGQPAPGHLLATHATLLRNNKILVVGEAVTTAASAGEWRRRVSTTSPPVPGAHPCLLPPPMVPTRTRFAAVIRMTMQAE